MWTSTKATHSHCPRCQLLIKEKVACEGQALRLFLFWESLRTSQGPLWPQHFTHRVIHSCSKCPLSLSGKPYDGTDDAGISETQFPVPTGDEKPREGRGWAGVTSPLCTTASLLNNGWMNAKTKETIHRNPGWKKSLLKKKVPTGHEAYPII